MSQILHSEDSNLLKVRSVDAGTFLKNETNLKKSSSLNTQIKKEKKEKTRKQRKSLPLDLKKASSATETKSPEKK
jgi:hypothetical protein